MIDHTLFLTALGLNTAHFILGLMIAGLRATSMGELDDRKKAGAAIMFSALAAGILSNPAATVVNHRVLPELEASTIAPVIAVLLGFFTPAGVRLGIALFKRKEGDKP